MLSVITVLLAVLGLAIIVVIVFVIVSDIKWHLYESKLEYRERYATVVKIDKDEQPDTLVPINLGNNTFMFNRIEGGSSADVTYKDEAGNLFFEYFSEDICLKEGDKVIIAVGYDEGNETENVKFVERIGK